MNINTKNLILGLVLTLPFIAGVKSQELIASEEIVNASLTKPNVELKTSIPTLNNEGMGKTASSDRTRGVELDSHVLSNKTSEDKLDKNTTSSKASEDRLNKNAPSNKSTNKSTKNTIVENAPSAGLVEHVIDQKNKAFSQTSITATIGDKVKFVNSDSYFHNVYSLSDTAQFDLGSYPKGESRTITLNKPGKVVARCAIHPQMQLDITVMDE